jgi:hypothetical protein
VLLVILFVLMDFVVGPLSDEAIAAGA